MAVTKKDPLLVEPQIEGRLRKALKSDSQLQILRKKGYRNLWGTINVVYPTLSEIVKKQRDFLFGGPSSSSSS
eukprot:c34453_g1_i1 orf=3-218(-)